MRILCKARACGIEDCWVACMNAMAAVMRLMADKGIRPLNVMIAMMQC